MNRRKAHIIAQNGNSNSLFCRGLLAYVVSRSIYSKAWVLLGQGESTIERTLFTYALHSVGPRLYNLAGSLRSDGTASLI